MAVSRTSGFWLIRVIIANGISYSVQGIPNWPVYSNANPQDFVFTANSTSHPEPDTYRANGTAFINSIDTDQFHR